MKPREFILEALQKEYSFKEGTDIDKVNFVEEGYMDSLGMVKFIIELEEEFGISFSDEDLSSGEFRVVGKLVDMIEKKIEEL